MVTAITEGTPLKELKDEYLLRYPTVGEADMELYMTLFMGADTSHNGLLSEKEVALLLHVMGNLSNEKVVEISSSQAEDWTFDDLLQLISKEPNSEDCVDDHSIQGPSADSVSHRKSLTRMKAIISPTAAPTGR